MSKKTRESLLITLLLAVIVIVFTKFDPNMLKFVGLFVALECIYLGLSAGIERIKNRKQA